MVELDPVVSWTIALSAAALFAAAAVHKLCDWPRFTGALADYRVLPGPLVRFAAPLVVAAESAAAVLLLNPGSRELGAVIAAVLLVCYAGAIAINLRRGRTTIDCGCVGVARRRHIGAGLVIRNLVLAGLVLLTLLPFGSRSLAALDGLTIVGTTLLAAVIYLTMDVLSSNAAASRGAPR
jgi:hypothetical protein